MSYYNEKKETQTLDHESAAYYINLPFGGGGNFYNLFPFMRPYDSRYWEAAFKGSLESGFGPAKFAVTLTGGFIFSGENNLTHLNMDGPEKRAAKFIGNVNGWNIGEELWVRYPLKEDVLLPFVLRMKYQTVTRDGNGLGVNSFPPFKAFVYENRESNYHAEVGGGVERKLLEEIKFGAGMYYVFLGNRNNFLSRVLTATGREMFDQRKYPNEIEHQVILRLAAEKDVSPMVAMRSGVEFFYGKVSKKYESPSQWPEYVSVDGPHWGMRVSLGGTVKFGKLNIEPFWGGGYQAWNLDGTGTISAGNVLGNFVRMAEVRREWFTGGGFSITF